MPKKKKSDRGKRKSLGAELLAVGVQETRKVAPPKKADANLESETEENLTLKNKFNH